MQVAVQSVFDVLGNEGVDGTLANDPNRLVQVIRAGIPVESVDRIVNRFHLTHAELSRPLGVSPSTMKRRRQKEVLSPSVSDRLVSVAKVLAMAEEILGDADKASRWLHKANRALNGDSPLSRLDTQIGFEQVKELLSRIDQGLFA